MSGSMPLGGNSMQLPQMGMGMGMGGSSMQMQPQMGMGGSSMQMPPQMGMGMGGGSMQMQPQMGGSAMQFPIPPIKCGRGDNASSQRQQSTMYDPNVNTLLQQQMPQQQMPQQQMPMQQPMQPMQPMYEPTAANGQITDARDQLVNDILHDMNDTSLNDSMFQYATDPVNIPPQPLSAQSNSGTISDLNNTITAYVTNNKLLTKFVDIDRYPWLGIIINICIVFATLLFVSLPCTNKLIFNYLPNLLHENGQVSLRGVLLKCVIGITLYTIMLMFL
jgi:hypothetical protein